MFRLELYRVDDIMIMEAIFFIFTGT